MGRRGRACPDCGQTYHLLEDELCGQCESDREQRLGIGFYDPLKKSNPELYWKREREYSSQRHREENMAGMIISVVVGISVMVAVFTGILFLIAKAMNIH